MIRDGLVMEINKGSVGIITSEGEYLYVYHSSFPPVLGCYYQGEYIEVNIIKKILKRIFLLLLAFIFIALAIISGKSFYS